MRLISLVSSFLILLSFWHIKTLIKNNTVGDRKWGPCLKKGFCKRTQSKLEGLNRNQSNIPQNYLQFLPQQRLSAQPKSRITSRAHFMAWAMKQQRSILCNPHFKRECNSHLKCQINPIPPKRQLHKSSYWQGCVQTAGQELLSRGRFQYYSSTNIPTENTAPQKNNRYYNKGGTHQPTRMCAERHRVEFWDTRRKVILQAESFPCPEQFCASPHPEPKGCQILCCPRAAPSSAELSVIDTGGNLVWMGEYGHTLLLSWCYRVTSQLFQ